MKIRNGFVSNSSSSSFIIKTTGKFKTVYDVAKQIMLDLGEDQYFDELRNLELYKNKAPNVPVFFETSDGSYIRKFNNYIIISTTMHYSINVFLSEIVNFKEFDEGYFKEFDYIDEDGEHEITHCEDFDYYYNKFDDFLILKYNVFGLPDYEFRNKCKCGSYRVIKLKGVDKTICYCKAKKYSRKQKLDKIIKKIKDYEN